MTARALRLGGAARRIADDAVYRGSTTLLLNTTLLALFGFAFWAVSARLYPPSDVGAFNGVVAGVGLLAAVGALGLPNTLMRHLAVAEEARRLATAAVVAATTAGGGLCLLVLLVLGPHLPSSLDLARTDHRLLVAALAVIAAVSAVIDAGLIAVRATQELLVKNLAGSVLKLVALGALAAAGLSGMLALALAYGAGAGLAAAIGGVALARRVRGGAYLRGSLGVLRRHLSFSGTSYAGAITGILPATVVPLMVLGVRGPEQTAYFAAAFMLATFLNFVPSTTAQVLMAEASRGEQPLRDVTMKALRHVYALLLPAVVVLAIAAPLVLRLFGDDYARGATGCLQLLALGALATGCTYLIDSILAARDRMGAYILINALNAALVLALVGVMLPRGLTAAAGGWALAQTVSVLLGVVLLRTTGVWRRAGQPGRAPRLRAARPKAE
ncbi:lipopolysaccharide biosynthesis protein [Miltoncostaea marina]|uniref:lipopolysaccharide biosynthesis protein n=1 Tax=Miltoncostaea marina TaxID=2843215 RepID=UPI001C3D9E07|nr:oligosaccharide flippase family protein [Miltoncostaea marina]